MRGGSGDVSPGSPTYRFAAPRRSEKIRADHWTEARLLDVLSAHRRSRRSPRAITGMRRCLPRRTYPRERPRQGEAHKEWWRLLSVVANARMLVTGVALMSLLACTQHAPSHHELVASTTPAGGRTSNLQVSNRTAAAVTYTWELELPDGWQAFKLWISSAVPGYTLRAETDTGLTLARRYNGDVYQLGFTVITGGLPSRVRATLITSSY